MAQSREQRQLMADIRMLQEQTQELAIAVASLTQTLQESLRAVNTRIDENNIATRRALADQKVSIDELGKDTRAVRERVDDTNVRVSNIREELEALRSAVATPPPAPAPTPVDGADPTTTPAPPPPSPSTAGLSPTRMFETARADYAAGQWSLALTGFEAFLKTFPRSDMADDAQFFIGETHFAQNRWGDAVAAYNQVIQKYASANAVPDAYYKRGLALERLGQLDAAQESWDAAVKNFPDSDAGRLAKQNLDRIGRRTTP
jgi:tol-pal system protein YbgF